MLQWYSLNSSAIYFNDKMFQEKGFRRILMILCWSEQRNVLNCYEYDDNGVTDDKRILTMELDMCELGFADLSRNIFTLKYNDCLHTFQMKNENQTDCWYSKLSSIVSNSNNCNKDPAGKSRERTTSVGIVSIKSKSLWQRQLTPITLERSNILLETTGKESHIRSATSECLHSNGTSTSIDLSDEVFNSNVSRSVWKDSSDKSFNNFTEGYFKENDLMFLFDTIRDKANQHITDIRIELILTQIDFLENVLYFLSQDKDYIENRCERKIRSILESEREENPTLPSFNKLPNISFYVDNYGFKHSLEDDSFTKLICQKLLDDLKLKSQSLNPQVKIMNQAINSPCVDIDMVLENIDNYSFIGFPAILRKPMWNILATHHLKKIEFPVKQTNNYFVMLLQQVNNVNIDIRKIIKIESYKMYKQNIFFDQIDSTKIKSVQNIMMAIYVRNSVYKYSSLLMKISALGILILEPAEVFRLLVAISESLIGSKILNKSFSNSLGDQMFLKDLISNQNIELHNHFLKTKTDLNFLTKKWIENIFIDSLPFESSLRIFDLFLIKGQEWIILLCCTIITLESKKILVLNKAFDIYKHLNTRYSQLYDIEYILEETRKLEISFTPGYIETKRKEFDEQYFSSDSNLSFTISGSDPIRFQDNSTAFRHIPGKIECTTFNDEYIFISVARLSNSVIYILNFLRGFLKENSIKVEFFVSVMRCVSSLILVASDTGIISAFDNKEKQWLWKVILQNCPLDMIVIDNESTPKLFVGLDNGSLAIKEDLFLKNSTCTFHLHVSLYAINKMVYADPYIICGSKDHILIIDPSTTTIVHKIHLYYESPFIIQDMKVDKYYLWLVFKGSTIIQLWNIESCIQMFSQNITLFQGRRTINGSITILHPIVGQNQLWVGTDTGEMFIYDVKCCMSREIPFINSDLQINNNNNSWECHQSVVDKVTEYLSSMSQNSDQNNMDSQENGYQSQLNNSKTERYQKRLSVTMIDNDFVDISILGERIQQGQHRCSIKKSIFQDHEQISDQNSLKNNDIHDTTPNTIMNFKFKEEIHLKQKTFLSLKGGMKISDSPIQHSCPLMLSNDIGEAFITLSSYMEEENNMVIWKQGAQGWKYKVMHYQSMDKSKSIFSRLFQKINFPLI